MRFYNKIEYQLKHLTISNSLTRIKFYEFLNILLTKNNNKHFYKITIYY